MTRTIFSHQTCGIFTNGPDHLLPFVALMLELGAGWTRMCVFAFSLVKDDVRQKYKLLLVAPDLSHSQSVFSFLAGVLKGVEKIHS